MARYGRPTREHTWRKEKDEGEEDDLETSAATREVGWANPGRRARNRGVHDVRSRRRQAQRWRRRYCRVRGVSLVGRVARRALAGLVRDPPRARRRGHADPGSPLADDCGADDRGVTRGHRTGDG